MIHSPLIHFDPRLCANAHMRMEIGMTAANGQIMNAKKQKVVRYKDGQGLFYNE
jgi:hypothetical protein